MLSANDVTQLYNTILSIPGMNEMVKIDIKISRKNVLFLNTLVNRGIASKKDDASGLLSSISKEGLQEIKALTDGCLEKAGLVELNAKLDALENAK